MITHSIVLYKEPRAPVGKEMHKECIFERTLTRLNENVFYEGGHYKVKGSKEEGVLIFICSKLDEVEWDGLKVKFLELWFPDTQKTELYHPSDLKAV